MRCRSGLFLQLAWIVLLFVFPHSQDDRGDPSGRLVELDLDGVVTTLTDEPDTYNAPAYSPDGSRIAFQPGSRTNQDVWIYDTEREDVQRLTFDESSETRPSWTPDGRRVVFSSDRRGAHDLYWKEVDGSGAAEPLTETDTYLFAAGWSPDGRWLAYLSNESGRNEVYVQPLPRGVDIEDISPDGRKFLALQSADEDQQSEDRQHLQFVFHGFTELADASPR